MEVKPIFVREKQNNDFCPFCGSILPMAAEPGEVECRLCGTVLTIKPKVDQLVCTSFKNYERTVADSENAKLSGGDAEVDHVCTKCGHDRATFSTMQTRSADEGQTVFYTCLECKNKDIEYS